MDTLDAGKQKPVVNEYLVFKYACYTEIIPMSASEIMPLSIEFRFRPLHCNGLESLPTGYKETNLTNYVVDLAAVVFL
jgi:hypothetical protein